MKPRIGLVALFVVLPSAAHTVSTSSGNLTISGTAATYELRMPAYELQHVPNANEALPRAVALEGAVLTKSECVAGSAYTVCTAAWLYPAPPSEIHLTSRLHEITVANHVHVVRARRGDLVDRAILDSGEPSAALRFRDSGRIEGALRERPSVLLAVLLLALTLALAADSLRQFAAFLATAIAGAFVPLILTPAFAEAVVATVCAYLCLESAFLGGARVRWPGVAALGIASALYMRTLWAEPGIAAATQAVVGAAALLSHLAIRRNRQFARLLAIACMAGALAWTAVILLK